MYSTDVCLKENRPKPVKAIMNLVTSATTVTFNPTTEILAVASNEADEAVKLVWSASFLSVTLLVSSFKKVSAILLTWSN